MAKASRLQARLQSDGVEVPGLTPRALATRRPTMSRAISSICFEALMGRGLFVSPMSRAMVSLRRWGRPSSKHCFGRQLNRGVTSKA